MLLSRWCKPRVHDVSGRVAETTGSHVTEMNSFFLLKPTVFQVLWANRSFQCNAPYEMPTLKKHAKLKTGPVRSRKAAADVNREFQKKDLSYSTSSGSTANAGLRALKQISYDELCSWSQQKCIAYLFEKGVLSDDMPVCYSCFKPMQKVDRSANGTVACFTSGCYHHPRIAWPRESYTPLHAQARQLLGTVSFIL